MNTKAPLQSVRSHPKDRWSVASSQPTRSTPALEVAPPVNRSRTTPTPRPTRVVALAVLIMLLGGWLATPAGAGGGPYGSTTTTDGVGVQATCGLSVTEGGVGTSVTATVSNVPPGGTVRILFGGSEVASGTAPIAAQGTGAVVLLGGRQLAEQAATTSIVLQFVVPDVPPGSYLVTAVGVGFTCVCSPQTNGMFSVLGAAVDRPGGGGALPRTGIYAALFVAIAVALLVLGRTLLEASRRRRRRAEREARAAANHFAAKRPVVR